jgi:hypothetical protein
VLFDEFVTKLGDGVLMSFFSSIIYHGDQGCRGPSFFLDGEEGVLVALSFLTDLAVIEVSTHCALVADTPDREDAASIATSAEMGH